MENPDFDKYLVAPRERGSEKYTQWQSKLRKEVAKIYQIPPEARRLFVACIDHLKVS